MDRRLYTPIAKKGKSLNSNKLSRDNAHIYRGKNIQLNATKSDNTRNIQRITQKPKRLSYKPVIN